MWFRETGEEKSAKALGVRYTRIKNSIACVKPDHYQSLREARARALENIEQQKKVLDGKLWALVADDMKEKHPSEEYSVRSHSVSNYGIALIVVSGRPP